MVKSAENLWAKSPAFQRARLAGLPYNLVKSGDLQGYYQILTDFDFLADKVNHRKFGVSALIADYDLLDDAEVLNHPEYNPEKVKALKLIQGALRLSAHILQQERTQLAEQLWGRLVSFRIPEIQAILNEAKQSKTTWLRPLTNSLTPPGGRLLRTFSGHSSYVNAVAFTPDGKHAISASSDTTLKLWNLETGEELFTFSGHNALVSAVAVTPDGKRAISGSWDKTIKLWNLETGEELLTFSGHRNWVSAVAVTPDGKRAISGSRDKTIKLWNLETGEELLTFSGHRNWVTVVAVTPDGKRAISGSEDKTIKLWNLETGNFLASFIGDSSIFCCAVAPDGVTIVAGEQSGRVYSLQLEGMEK